MLFHGQWFSFSLQANAFSFVANNLVYCKYLWRKHKSDIINSVYNKIILQIDNLLIGAITNY